MIGSRFTKIVGHAIGTAAGIQAGIGFPQGQMEEAKVH